MNFLFLKPLHGFPLYLGQKSPITDRSCKALRNPGHTHFFSPTSLTPSLMNLLPHCQLFNPLKTSRSFPPCRPSYTGLSLPGVNIHLVNPNILAKLRLNVSFSTLNYIFSSPLSQNFTFSLYTLSEYLSVHLFV